MLKKKNFSKNQLRGFTQLDRHLVELKSTWPAGSEKIHWEQNGLIQERDSNTKSEIEECILQCPISSKLKKTFNLCAGGTFMSSCSYVLDLGQHHTYSQTQSSDLITEKNWHQNDTFARYVDYQLHVTRISHFSRYSQNKELGSAPISENIKFLKFCSASTFPSYVGIVDICM